MRTVIILVTGGAFSYLNYSCRVIEYNRSPKIYQYSVVAFRIIKVNNYAI